MKLGFIFLAIFILSPGLSQQSHAHPFRKEIVCAPAETLKANQKPLTFELREGGPCGPGEQWMRVDHNEGVTYLLPMSPPLSPETQRDLQGYKNYYRIRR